MERLEEQNETGHCEKHCEDEEFSCPQLHSYLERKELLFFVKIKKYKLFKDYLVLQS